MAEKSPGKIITFYSYKGGVGRSMTLANVAWILASNGRRVLVIDWDLEAPGVHRYFMPFLPDRDLITSDGMIDFVLDYASEVMTPPATAVGADGNWFTAQADLLPYAASLEWRFPDGGTLDFVGAGRQGTSYSTRVNTFDWGNFYNRLDGGRFLEEVKRQLRQEYDFILIDSRTGASDTSGICTVQMPDALVVCFTLNNQSIDGAATVANSAFTQRGRSGLEVYPVPMRIDLYEKDKLAAGRAYARQRLGLFPEHLDRQQYWGQVELLYVPYYSYEELLATFGDEPGESNTLLAWTERLTGYLTGGEVQRSGRIPAQDRHAALRLYLRRGEGDAQRDSKAILAEQLFSTLTREGQDAARRVFSRLVRVGTKAAEDELARAPLSDLATRQSVPQAFASAGILRIDVSSGEEVVRLGDANLLREWGRLREWIDSDREFLLWRQSLDLWMNAWEEHGRPRAGFLRSDFLRKALSVRKGRRESLSPRELRFIALSVRAWARKWVVVASGILMLVLGMVTSGKIILDERRADQLKHDINIAGGLLHLRDPMSVVGLYDAAISQYSAHRPLLRLGMDKRTLAEAYVGRGMAYLEAHEPRLATIDFNNAIESEPALAEAYAGRAKVNAFRGDFPSASADYQRALELSPGDAQLWSGLARLKLNGGDASGAAVAYSKALDIDKSDLDAYYGRALAKLRLRDEQSAADDLAVAKRAVDPAVRKSAMLLLEKLRSAKGGPGENRPHIFIKYNDPKDLAIVRNIAELGEVVQLAQQPTAGDVRYFFPQDESLADAVRAHMEHRLALWVHPQPKLTVIGLNSQDFPRVRPGDVEVWLPSLAPR